MRSSFFFIRFVFLVLDDGDEQIYLSRIQKNKNMKDEPVHMVDNLFKVPQSIWKRLYRYIKYQKYNNYNRSIQRD